METLYRRIMTREWYTFEPLEIDALQRYDEAKVCDIKKIVKSGNWEYVKYSDLVELLRN